MESLWDFGVVFYQAVESKQANNKQIKQGEGINEVFHCKTKKKCS